MNYISISIFAFIAGCLRYLISSYTDDWLIIVNLTGALLFGYIYKKFKHVNHPIKTGFTTGFLGSFTTLSSLMLMISSEYIQVIIMIVAGLLCAKLGMIAGEKL